MSQCHRFILCKKMNKKECFMQYKVIVYFDNMVDEILEFKTKGAARKCLAQLKNKYNGQRLYKMEMRKQ